MPNLAWAYFCKAWKSTVLSIFKVLHKETKMNRQTKSKSEWKKWCVHPLDHRLQIIVCWPNLTWSLFSYGLKTKYVFVFFLTFFPLFIFLWGEHLKSILSSNVQYTVWPEIIMLYIGSLDLLVLHNCDFVHFDQHLPISPNSPP